MNSETKKLNVLMHGNGVLGNAIARSIENSPLLGNFYILGSDVNINTKAIHVGTGKELSIGDLKKFLKEKEIDFAISFHELFSIRGLVNFYQETLNFPIIGCQQSWFYLEYSKRECKEFMNRHNIKTADYMTIFDKKDANFAIETFGLPLVIKNNHLQAGFGSYICHTKKECEEAIKKNLKDFDYCLAEKFLVGEEITQQYIWDKENLITLQPVKDLKKAQVGNKYINTGGLASYTPVTLTDEQRKQLEEYNQKLAELFKKIKPQFTSIIALNLIFTNDGIYTLEFNMRPGVTEFESTIESLDCDLLEILWKTINGTLKQEDIKYKNGITGCVTIAHKDYLKQKRGKHLKKINISKILEKKKDNIKTNFNLYKIINKDTVEISKSHRFMSVLCTSEKDPFEEIYNYIKDIEEKDFYYIKNVNHKN